MDAPKEFVGVLKAMEEVDIKIMRNQKEQYLRGNGPMAHKVKMRPVKVSF
jgi:predicted RNA-binding protein